MFQYKNPFHSSNPILNFIKVFTSLWYNLEKEDYNNSKKLIEVYVRELKFENINFNEKQSYIFTKAEKL